MYGSNEVNSLSTNQTHPPLLNLHMFLSNNRPTCLELASIVCVFFLYLLLSNEPRFMRESSIAETISLVLSPRSRSSPRFLKLPNRNSCPCHSAITVFSLASISFSFTAEMQMSWKKRQMIIEVGLKLLLYLHDFLSLFGSLEIA